MFYSSARGGVKYPPGTREAHPRASAAGQPGNQRDQARSCAVGRTGTVCRIRGLSRSRAVRCESLQQLQPPI